MPGKTEITSKMVKILGFAHTLLRHRQPETVTEEGAAQATWSPRTCVAHLTLHLDSVKTEFFPFKQTNQATNQNSHLFGQLKNPNLGLRMSSSETHLSHFIQKQLSGIGYFYCV